MTVSLITPVGMTAYLGAMSCGSAQEEDDEYDEEDEREAAATVVAETRAHAVAAKAGAEDQEDEKNYKKHGRLRSERILKRPVQGPEGWMQIQGGW
jgi:hypothetical protein